MAEDIKTTLQFQADITDFKGAMSEARSAIKLANSQFNVAASSMDDWSKSTEGLTAKLNQLSDVEAAEKRKLEVLRTAYEKVKEEQGENSAAAQDLAAKINNQQAVVNKTQREFNKYSKKLEEVEDGSKDVDKKTEAAAESLEDAGKAADDAADGLDDAADSADKASGEFKLLDKVAGGLKKVMKGVATAFAAGVTATLAAAEGTREYRREMAKMATNAAEAGQDMGAMKDTLFDVAAVTGDMDAAMEGMNMLMATGLDTSNIEMAADALTGAAMKFDGLNFESLAEGLQESLAVGEAVGPFAELIERTGGDLEAFNKGLARCTTEADRQAYVMQYLADSGLADVHDAYVQNNSDLVEAEKATFRLNDAIAGIGAIAEPLMTALKNLGAGILETITPAIAMIGRGIELMINGSSGVATLTAGITSLLDKIMNGVTTVAPGLIEVLSTVLPTIITTILNALPTIVGAIIQVVPQLITALIGLLPTLLASLLQITTEIIAGLAAMLPTIVQAIVQVVPQLITALLENLPALLEAAITLLMALVDAIPTIIVSLSEALPDIITEITTFLSENLETILNAAVTLLMAIVDALPQIITSLGEALPEIIETLVGFLTGENIDKILEAAITLLTAIVDAIPDIIDSLTEALPDIISTIISAVSGAVPQLLSAAIELFFALLRAAGSLLAMLPGKLGEIRDSIFDGISKAVPNVLKAATDIFNTIFDKIAELPGEMLTLGGNIVSGIWDGITGSIDWLLDKIGGFCEDILNKALNFFGIASPSKLMRDLVGENIGLGMAEGILNSQGAVNGAVRKLSEAAAGGLTSGIGELGTGTGAGGRQIIFNQTNNSPRALSRREIYRQTHNALSYIGGV